MNSCHVCTTIPKRDHIISCDYCQISYCFKCIQVHLNESAVQKTFIICNFDTIKLKKQSKNWLCFYCQKLCLCKACKGMSLKTIEKQLLGKKATTLVGKKIEDFQKYFEEIQIFKNMNFTQLTPFEQEYFMNKAMLYCKLNETQTSSKKHEDQQITITKSIPQQAPINQNVIQIDSDENPEAKNQIEEQVNQQQISVNQEIQNTNSEIQDKKQIEESMAIQIESRVENSELRRNFEAIDVEGSNVSPDRIVEEPKINQSNENGIAQAQVATDAQKEPQN